jgi:hypothetical protein
MRATVRLATLAAAAVLATGCGGGTSSSHAAPQLSAACKHDVGVQNAFVHRMVALGYPNVSTLNGIFTVDFDRGLLKGLRKVCPATAKIDTLPSS